MTKTIEKKMERVDREPPLADQFSFSIDQTARLTSLSRSSVLKEIKDGTLPTIRRRNRILITADQLKEYLSKEQQVAG